MVSASILAGNSKEKFVGDVFNIGNGGNVSINEVADMIGDEKVYGEIRLEPFETLADNNKAKAVLGWEPKGNLHRFIKEELWELDQLKNYTKKL